jgi:hypothetical protein
VWAINLVVLQAVFTDRAGISFVLSPLAQARGQKRRADQVGIDPANAVDVT